MSVLAEVSVTHARGWLRPLLSSDGGATLSLGHNHVGTEHLLLALLEHENGIGVLADAGLDAKTTEHFMTAELARESAAHEQAAAERA